MDRQRTDEPGRDLSVPPAEVGGWRCEEEGTETQKGLEGEMDTADVSPPGSTGRVCSGIRGPTGPTSGRAASLAVSQARTYRPHLWLQGFPTWDMLGAPQSPWPWAQW